jgi:hypothetical protein
VCREKVENSLYLALPPGATRFPVWRHLVQEGFQSLRIAYLIRVKFHYPVCYEDCLLSVYAAEKLIAQARQLAAEYRRTMGKPLPGISNEIAQHDATKLLKLEAYTDAEAGFDAIDPSRQDKRIQIKSRTIFDESKSGQRIGQMKLDGEWDSVVLVLMDEDYEPYEIYEAEREDILEFIGKSSSSRNKRGAMSVARFKIIGQRVWTKENGLEAEIWDNQAG